jgi:hypothetical protein
MTIYIVSNTEGIHHIVAVLKTREQAVAYVEGVSWLNIEEWIVT